MVPNQKTNYLIHNEIYQDLKSAGLEGWGGETYIARMEAWDQVIQNLLGRSEFPKPPARILELGSGAGDIALKFAKLGFEAFGIEISPIAVAWANEKAFEKAKDSINKNLQAQFVQGCVTDLSQFPDEFFDAVIDGNCFHCIIGPDRKKTLDEVSRVLRKDGVFYVGTMIGDPKPGKAHLKFDPISRCQIQKGVPYRYMAQKEEVMNELNESGFSVIHQEVSQRLWWDHFSCLARLQKTLAIILLLAGSIVPATASANSKKEHRHHGAHVHGTATLNIAFDQLKGRVEFKSASEAVIGFEHAAKSEKDKKKINDTIAKFATGIGSMIQFEEALGCIFSKGKIEVVTEEDHDDSSKGHVERQGEHSDFVANFTIECKKEVKGTKVVFDFSQFKDLKDLDITLLVGDLQKSIEVKRKPVSVELK